MRKLTDLGLLLSAQHDRCLQMDVDDDVHLVVTRLEEEMFDIAEKEIYRTARLLAM